EEDIKLAIKDAGFDAKSSEQDRIILGVFGICTEMDLQILEGMLGNLKGVRQFRFDLTRSELEVLFDPEAIIFISIVDNICGRNKYRYKVTVKNPYPATNSSTIEESAKMFRLFTSSLFLSKSKRGSSGVNAEIDSSVSLSMDDTDDLKESPIHNMESSTVMEEIDAKHRDMKPNNFLIEVDRQLKLANFGLARIFGSPDRSLMRLELISSFGGALSFFDGYPIFIIGFLVKLDTQRPTNPGVCFSPSNDKIIATVGLDKKLYTFDSGSRRPTFCIPYEAPFSSLAFRDDGWMLAARTNNGRVVFYDVRGKPEPITALRAYSNSENISWITTTEVINISDVPPLIIEKSSLEKIEEGLARARTVIREAVRTRNYTFQKEEDFIPRGSPSTS
ncbi:hypothetical protein IFM89_024535, partial [Coptis chinensis]